MAPSSPCASDRWAGLATGAGMGTPAKPSESTLAIAYAAVVHKHGGELSFESEPGRGTTFTVVLTCSAVGERVAGGRPPSPDPRPHSAPSALTGSTSVARRAGTYAASSATPTRRAPVTASVTGSRPSTS